MDQFPYLIAAATFRQMKEANQIQPINDESGTLVGLMFEQLPSQHIREHPNMELVVESGAAAIGPGYVDYETVELGTFTMAARDFGADEVSIGKIRENSFRIIEQSGKKCIVWKDDYTLKGKKRWWEFWK